MYMPPSFLLLWIANQQTIISFQLVKMWNALLWKFNHISAVFSCSSHAAINFIMLAFSAAENLEAVKRSLTKSPWKTPYMVNTEKRMRMVCFLKHIFHVEHDFRH